jgi:hypothetical protein
VSERYYHGFSEELDEAFCPPHPYWWEENDYYWAKEYAAALKAGKVPQGGRHEPMEIPQDSVSAELLLDIARLAKAEIPIWENILYHAEWLKRNARYDEFDEQIINYMHKANMADRFAHWYFYKNDIPKRQHWTANTISNLLSHWGGVYENSYIDPTDDESALKYLRTKNHFFGSVI